MDSELRAKIMKSALGGGQETRPSKPIVETKHEGVQDKIFEHRTMLKQVHAYEKRIKKDSEDWDDEDWKAFEASQQSSVSPSNMMSLIDEVLENKKRQESSELDERRAVRKAIVSGDFLNKIGLFNK